MSSNVVRQLKPYPDSWSRATCTAKRAEFAEQALYCHNCFAVCPAGRLADEELLRFEEAQSILRRAEG